MLNPEEIRWIQATANDLNNLIQVIAESSQILENLCPRTAETDKYFAIVQSGLERMAKVTGTMADRAGGSSSPETALPAIVGLPAPEIATPEAGEICNSESEGELVMIVDDEEFVRLLAQQVLCEEGYRVLTARDGFRAIELYRRYGDQIDLIVLDFTMPVMDGSDVFNELRELNPDVSVVLSSGFTEHERLRGMLANGLRGFIPKPYTQEKFLSQIRSTLDALRAERTGERRVL